jgi:hypothetical protein
MMAGNLGDRGGVRVLWQTAGIAGSRISSGRAQNIKHFHGFAPPR